MLAAMQTYETHVGDDVPMRPDHIPMMAGEDNSNPGYHTNGRLFAIGYMKGLESNRAPTEPTFLHWRCRTPSVRFRPSSLTAWE